MKHIFEIMLLTTCGITCASEFSLLKNFDSEAQIFEEKNYQQIKRLFQQNQTLGSAHVIASVAGGLYFVSYKSGYKCFQQVLKECENGACCHKKEWQENLEITMQQSEEQLKYKKSYMLQREGNQVILCPIEEQ